MLSTRGMVLAVGAVCCAIAGLVYGVEEFLIVAISVGVLLALGIVSVSHRVRVSRRAIRVVVKVPVAEVTARQSAVVELTVTNSSRRRRPPLVVEDPDGHWSVSYPGSGQSAVAGARPGPASGPPRAFGGTTSRRQATPDRGWLGSPGSRPDARRRRRRRHRDRRALSRAHRLAGLRPGADATLSVRVPTGTRGLLSLSEVGLWCEDPFRLLALRITVAPPAHVIVYPALAAVPEHVQGAAPRSARRDHVSSADRSDALSGDELSGLRPYAPGDRLTRLHWPSLARTGDLVVREFVEPRAGSLSLLVDLRPSAHSADSVERAVSRAAALGDRALQRGLTVELCTSAGDRMVIAPGAPGRQTMLRALALLGPASAPPAVVRRWGDRPTGGAVWATGGAPGADIVLVTTAAGAAHDTLPESLRHQAETVLVP